MTLFGGMTTEDDAKDTGDKIKIFGRYSDMGACRGCCVCEAPDAKTIADWAFNWKDMATINTWPMVTDDELRKIILKKDPAFSRDYSKYCNAEPKEGESLYWIRFKLYTETKMKAYELLANMTEEQDVGDSGAVTPYIRCHNMGSGTGVIIASAPTAADVHAWAFNWAPMCECEITPVTTDMQCRDVITSKPDFKKKHAALMLKMGMGITSNGH